MNPRFGRVYAVYVQRAGLDLTEYGTAPAPALL